MNDLFVSKEHKRQSSLRTNKAYHCIVYVTLGLGLMQIPVAVLLLWEKNMAAEYALKREAAKEEQKRLEVAVGPLRDLARKVEDAQSWSECLYQRITVSEVLSKLEQTVTENICFTEIALHNRAQGPRDPDNLEVEVQGFAKASAAEGWKLSVQRSFPEWTVSVPRIWRLGAATGPDGLEPLNLVLKQTAKTANRGLSK